MVTYGLRGAVATLLLETVRSYTATLLRTCHLNIDSLKSYKTLAGKEGKIKYLTIFAAKKDNNGFAFVKEDSATLSHGDSAGVSEAMEIST